MLRPPRSFLFFFFNDTATTEIYTLSLHDALPISSYVCGFQHRWCCFECGAVCFRDRKSTRLNSSHQIISYAVFCLKKKKKINGTADFVGLHGTEHMIRLMSTRLPTHTS